MESDARLSYNALDMRTIICGLFAISSALAWGVRGHQELSRAAVEALEGAALQFLVAQKDWIAYLAPIPDSYRTNAEPFLKIFEDPNHHWYVEQLGADDSSPAVAL